MNDNLSVSCKDVVKQYPIYKNNFERLKGLMSPNYRPQMFTALGGVSLDIKKGEILGIIGLNGSGKTTLSNTIAQITYPTSGDVQANGTVSMLSVNAGIDPMLTGRENIRYKCILLGFTPKYITEIQDGIIEFADIGLHIDQPVRTYSSGMRSRLGFAISTYLDPDILIIDEALSVGDNSFADKSRRKMEEFRHKGKTILFISHSVTQMQDFCDNIMWLHRGKVLGVDVPEKVIMPYCGFAREFNAMTKDERGRLEPALRYYQEKYL